MELKIRENQCSKKLEVLRELVLKLIPQIEKFYILNHFLIEGMTRKTNILYSILYMDSVFIVVKE